MIDFVVLALALVALFMLGSPDLAADRAREIGAVILAILITAPVVFSWKFLCAPAEIDEEASAEHDAEVALLNAEIESLRDGRSRELMYELSDNLAAFAAAVKALPRGRAHQIEASARETYRRAGEILEQMDDSDVKSDARDYLQHAEIILDKKANGEGTRGEETELAAIGRRVFSVLNSRDNPPREVEM